MIVVLRPVKLECLLHHCHMLGEVFGPGCKIFGRVGEHVQHRHPAPIPAHCLPANRSGR